MKYPKITVVTVGFNLIKANRKETFVQCLQSVHSQTYDNIEHLVIDGASTDGTVDILKEYADKGWIKYISEKDAGIYNAMNKGIKNATGDYIVFLNSDDFFHDVNAVKYAVETIEKTDCDFCGGDTYFIDEENQKRNHIRRAKLEQVFHTMPFCHQSMFCKKSVMIKENGFDETFKSAADYDFIIRLFLKQYKGAVIPHCFVTFRMGGESFENVKISHDECKAIARKYFGKYYELTQDDLEYWIYNFKWPAQLDKRLKKLTEYINKPKITIVTVGYNLIKNNRKKSFEKCVQSVSEQTYPNVEHLIIDGGSNDGTVDMLKKYAKSGLIKYISEPDKGIYDAMDKGIKHSTGDYIYFLNTDDYFYDKNIVKSVMKKFEKTNTDAVHGNLMPYMLDNAVGHIEHFIPNKVSKFKEHNNKNLLTASNIHHQTIFYNKRIFETASFFDENITEGSDWLLHAQAFLRDGYKYEYINKTITYFNLGGVSTNTVNENLVNEYIEFGKYIYKNFSEFMDKNDKDYKKIISLQCLTREKIKFFGISMIKIKKFKMIKSYYLFNLIPLLKVVNCPNMVKYHLFCIVPLALKKKYKVRKNKRIKNV